MGLFSDLLPEVLPDVPDCLNIVMEKAIRDAAIKFCEETHIWEVDLPTISLLADTAEYALAPPTNQQIIKLTQVIMNGRMIEPTSIVNLDSRSTTWRALIGTQPTNWLMVNPVTLRAYPIPSVDGAITAKAIVKPSRTATGIDDFISNDYYLAIAAGAKALLCAMPHKAWTALELVSYYQSIFNEGVNRAKLYKNSGFASADLPNQTQYLGA